MNTMIRSIVIRGAAAGVGALFAVGALSPVYAAPAQGASTQGHAVHSHKGAQLKPDLKDIVFASQAEALGLTPDQLRDQEKRGKLRDIVKDHHLTAAQFKTRVKAGIATRLENLVAQGKLSQTQADRIMKLLDRHFNRRGQHHPAPTTSPASQQ